MKVFINPVLLGCILLLNIRNAVYAIDQTNADAADTNIPSSEQVTTNTKPNILLILADDVGTGDIPVYWNSSIVDMPNIGRLAKMGVKFMDAHSTPLCAPSRYMLLSGNYAHRGYRPNGAWSFWENQNQFLDHQQSIAAVLKDAGYHTSMFGKWHLGAKAPSIEEGMEMPTIDYGKMLSAPAYNWSNPIIQGPQDIGFDTSYTTMSGIQDPPYSFYRDGRLTTKPQDIKYWNSGKYKMPLGTSIINEDHEGDGDVNWDSTAYNMILVNETIKFIDEHLDDNPSRPFFSYVALGNAHIPHSPPKKYIDGSNVQYQYKTSHACMLLEMDKVVGSLVSHLEDRDIAKNTIVIFTSDNGGVRKSDRLAEHRTSGPLRGKKGNIFEGGHRVPLIIRYDGTFPADATRRRMVGLNDLYATLCQIVGAAIPYGSAQDSVSFANYIEAPTKDNQKALRKNLATWTYTANKRKEEAIRRNSWKLIHYVPTSTFELYNLENDISETIDLSAISKYAKMMVGMKSLLANVGPCRGYDNRNNDATKHFFVKKLKMKKGCDWFRRKTKRCRTHLEGELRCPSVCIRNRDWC